MKAVLAAVLAAILPSMLLAQVKPAPARPATAPAAQVPEPPMGRTPGAGPVVVVDTVKGTFEFETYPGEAPKTVDHVLALVKKNFYNGLRVHRVEPGFVIQMGDPNTRDFTKRNIWGTSGSGTPVGVAELSRKRLHVRGAVAMAHSGNPARADAQFYVTLNAVPRLNGKYVVFGRVISGMEVATQLRVGDVIKKVSVKP